MCNRERGCGERFRKYGVCGSWHPFSEEPAGWVFIRSLFVWCRGVIPVVQRGSAFLQKWNGSSHPPCWKRMTHTGTNSGERTLTVCPQDALKPDVPQWVRPEDSPFWGHYRGHHRAHWTAAQLDCPPELKTKSGDSTTVESSTNGGRRTPRAVGSERATGSGLRYQQRVNWTVQKLDWVGLQWLEQPQVQHRVPWLDQQWTRQLRRYCSEAGSKPR